MVHLANAYALLQGIHIRDQPPNGTLAKAPLALESRDHFDPFIVMYASRRGYFKAAKWLFLAFGICTRQPVRSTIWPTPH